MLCVSSFWYVCLKTYAVQAQYININTHDTGHLMSANEKKICMYMIKNSMQTKVIYLALNTSCCFTLNVSGGWWCFRTLQCKNNCRQQCRKHCTYRKTPDSACPIESVRLRWDALGYISTSKDFNVPQKPCRISRKAATQPIFQKACGSQQRC